MEAPDYIARAISIRMNDSLTVKEKWRLGWDLANSLGTSDPHLNRLHFALAAIGGEDVYPEAIAAAGSGASDATVFAIFDDYIAGGGNIYAFAGYVRAIRTKGH